MLGALDIDESSDKSVGQQLKEALRKNAGRVIDLFREWDTDGDGQITRKEFHTAMPRLGFDVSKVSWLPPLCRRPSYHPYAMPRLGFDVSKVGG